MRWSWEGGSRSDGAFRWCDERPRRLDEDVAALRHPVREVDILLEGIAFEVVVEALVGEDLAPKRGEKPVEELHPAGLGKLVRVLGEEAAAYSPACLGPPPAEPEQAPPEDHRPRGPVRVERRAANAAELRSPALVLGNDLLVSRGPIVTSSSMKKIGSPLVSSTPMFRWRGSPVGAGWTYTSRISTSAHSCSISPRAGVSWLESTIQSSFGSTVWPSKPRPCRAGSPAGCGWR